MLAIDYSMINECFIDIISMLKNVENNTVGQNELFDKARDSDNIKYARAILHIYGAMFTALQLRHGMSFLLEAMPWDKYSMEQNEQMISNLVSHIVRNR